jgi:phage-related protein
VIEAQTKAVRLASEKIGKDLHQQVYDITFHTRDGKTIEVITKSQASSEECSMSGVDVYLVSTKIGGSAGQPSEGTTRK